MSKTTAATVAILMVVALATGCERGKTKMDREVDRLCAVDGGVHVYEEIKLPEAYFSSDGEVFPRFRHLPQDKGRYGPDYALRTTQETLKSGDPALYRFTSSFVRTSDGKLMGKSVWYVRRGGDMPGPWADSGYACPGAASATFAIEKRMFSKLGQ